MQEVARWARAVLVMGATILLAAGCSFSIGGQSLSDAAVELIEGDFSEQLGVELTNASCTDPASDEIGTTFACQATYAGDQVDFEVTVDAPDHIVARSTNLLYVDAQRAIGNAIATAFADQGIDGLVGEDLDCGGDAMVLAQDMTFVCALSTPPDGDVYDTTIRITDLQDLTFDFVVADQPRS